MANNSEKRNVDPNKHSYDEINTQTASMDVSIGNKQPADDTDGIEIRGCGAATKGRKARGPMA